MENVQVTHVTEIIRRVWCDDHGYVTVAPSPDFPGNVILYTEESEQNYFGPVRLDLPAEYMRQLGHALIAAADENKTS